MVCCAWKPLIHGLERGSGLLLLGERRTAICIVVVCACAVAVSDAVSITILITADVVARNLLQHKCFANRKAGAKLRSIRNAAGARPAKHIAKPLLGKLCFLLVWYVSVHYLDICDPDVHSRQVVRN